MDKTLNSMVSKLSYNTTNNNDISSNSTILIESTTSTLTAPSYSSNFLIVPTNNEQDEEVRAARVVESNLAHPPPPAQQHHVSTTPLVEEVAPKFPDNGFNTTADQEPDQQQNLNKNVIAGIVGASGAGMVAMIAVGILVWHNARRYRQQPSNKPSPKGRGGSDNERKSPMLFSLPGEPMIASDTVPTGNSYFHDWDQHHQHQSISKFPSSTYSALYTTAHDDTINGTTSLQTNNHHEDEWSSDTGSSESMSIHNLSTYYSVEENSTVTTTTIRQQQHQTVPPSQLAPSVAATIPLSISSSHQSTIHSQALNEPKQQKEEPDVLDKDLKHSLSLVNRKLLHYPARFRHGFTSSSAKILDQVNSDDDEKSDTATISYNLAHLFYPTESQLDAVALTITDQLEETDLTRHYFLTPFDLPASRFLPLPNCPFQLVTRQSILDDPEKRQGVHETS
ncbi:hypothetical protein BDA99DRAFT_561988 [Phascolomyces articulosus]|uniref:Uncharacterized protein n=1 Tax=Phascolomyces articulosus TaxID=60185 RepID=A0AAD5K5E8_9FUNG|nr:hypothetical protein BDA99DRAFT_561988 [Phascolomyces articulosus]